MRPFLLLIPLLPLLGFIFNITLGRRLSARAASDETPHGHGHGSSAPAHRRRRSRQRAAVVPGRGAGGAAGARGEGPRDRRDALHLAPGRPRRDGGAHRARRHAVQRRVGLPARPAVLGDGAVRHVRGLPDPRLFDRLHGPGPRLRALHGVPEPLHVRDAHAGAGRELRGAVRRLGRRRALLVPADRVLVRPAERDRRRQEGVHRQPRRRRGVPARDVPGVRQLRDARLPHAWRRPPPSCRSRPPGTARSRSSACCCSWAPPARARSSRSTSGCPTPWRVRPRSPR